MICYTQCMTNGSYEICMTHAQSCKKPIIITNGSRSPSPTDNHCGILFQLKLILLMNDATAKVLGKFKLSVNFAIDAPYQEKPVLLQFYYTFLLVIYYTLLLFLSPLHHINTLIITEQAGQVLQLCGTENNY